MDFDDQGVGWPELVQGVQNWLLVTIVLFFLVLIFATIVSVLQSGGRGPGRVAETLLRGLRDLFMSGRRVLSLASLTYKESVRRKTLWVLAVFVLLFMFAHWFLGSQAAVVADDADQAAQARVDVQFNSAKRYVAFVMSSIQFLLLPIAVILSCWGLPNDIKDRSLHTVVTKPARRSEIVFGRILGYSTVMSLVLAVMAVLGYVWILRAVPPRAKGQLIARVPIYGTLKFLNREGVEVAQGINTGDIWEYRGYIEGQTNSRGIYTYENLDQSVLTKLEQLTLEHNFEAFRTEKGNKIDQPLGFFLTFVNPDTGLQAQYPRVAMRLLEFSPDPEKRLIKVPRELSVDNCVFSRSGVGTDQQDLPVKADLFQDLMSNGKLEVQVVCEDPRQYIGMARPDLFFRLPDRPFIVSYLKAILCFWCMLVLVVSLGVAASTFVKGPVATLSVTSFLVMGKLLRGFMESMVTQFYNPKPGYQGVIGGGPLESLYRVLTQDPMISTLNQSWYVTAMLWIDQWILRWMNVMQYVIPDFRKFDGTPYLANGFDVPFHTRLLPSLLVLIAFLIPSVIIGTYSLMSRELEAK